MQLYKPRLIALCLLALILLALGYFIVPAHWTSIWEDREFTDWVSPISNRLHGQPRLYEHGLHIPMPPLPFVLVRILCPHGARWLDENMLNYLFQAGTILVLFYAFARELRVSIAFGAALAVIPVFLSLPKTILYDSMAQFLVALSAIATVMLVRGERGSSDQRFRPITWCLSASLGMALASSCSPSKARLRARCWVFFWPW